MKRERRSINDIVKFWNLFKWEYCGRCRKDFRRETGWSINKFYTAANGWQPHFTVCKACCPTIEDVDQYFKAVKDSMRNNWRKKKK